MRFAYKLTAKGKALSEVLFALVHWGKMYIPGTKTYKEATVDSKRASRRPRPSSN